MTLHVLLCDVLRSGTDTKPCYYNQDSTLPVYKWTCSQYHYSIEELSQILLTNSVPKEKICSRQPTRGSHNVAFVVDLNALDDYSDIRADENGVWKRKGAPIAFVSVHTSGHDSTTKVVRHTRMKPHSHYYKLSRTYYHHSCSPDFQRIITTVYGMLIITAVHVGLSLWFGLVSTTIPLRLSLRREPLCIYTCLTSLCRFSWPTPKVCICAVLL